MGDASGSLVSSGMGTSPQLRASLLENLSELYAHGSMYERDATTNFARDGMVGIVWAPTQFVISSTVLAYTHACYVMPESESSTYLKLKVIQQ